MGTKVSKLTAHIQRMRGNARESVEYDLQKCLKACEAIGKGYDPYFKMDDLATPLFTQLIKWFLNDSTFAGELYKGILLIGHKGTGKTLSLIIMRDFMRTCYPRLNMFFEIVEMIRVEAEFARNGFEYLISKSNIRLIMFDDLGTENLESKNYGNQIPIGSYLLHLRYSSYQSQGCLTLMTSNYTLEIIGKKYGDREMSRATEMFNLIKVLGDDRRQKKRG